MYRLKHINSSKLIDNFLNTTHDRNQFWALEYKLYKDKEAINFLDKDLEKELNILNKGFEEIEDWSDVIIHKLNMKIPIKEVREDKERWNDYIKKRIFFQLN